MSYDKENVPTNEDTIQCAFFSAMISTDSIEWEDVCKELNEQIQTISSNYIWHRDAFQIHTPMENMENIPHLSSTTCFGENIEDEWFIVYIIFEITKVHKDLIVQVKDSDGDFLLIEAADYLPPWANPENTDNRVFIYNNHIHIITPEMVNLEAKLELKEALQLIIQSPELTQASSDIEKAVNNRIKEYPSKALENIHKAVVKLPRNIATLLTMNHNFIAPIAESYCNHDVIDAKCCKNISFDDCVYVQVKFTRYLYAMLMHSKLVPYVKHQAEFDNDKKNILGLKILCGFQMLMSRSSNTDLFNSKEYTLFIQNLKQNGYFKNNIEGSADYNMLLSKAKDYFSANESSVSLHSVHKIVQLMSSDEFKKLQYELPDNDSEHCNNTQENEDWLNINSDQLDELLHTWYGKKSCLNSNNTSDTLTNKLSNFLKQTSDIEGIDAIITETQENTEIDFEPDEFVAGLEKMLKILSTENNDKDYDSNLSNSDYDCEDILSCSDDDCDKELKEKLQNDQKNDLKGSSRNVLTNIKQSMKEEKASTGPSSNLLRSIGIRKSDLLDSDDDE